MNRTESSEFIANTLDGWLNAEVRSSGLEVNTYLDKYDTAVRGLRGGWGDDDNFLARKAESHLGVRIPQAWQTYSMSLEPGASPKDREYQSAWLMFTPLMHVSGTHRGQCYIEATDAEDYLSRRHSRSAGIYLEETVYNRLGLWLPESGNFADARITLDSLKKHLDNASKDEITAIKRVSTRTALGFDFGQKNSPAAREMISAQHQWAFFVVDCITMAAKQRDGELSAVPFLEPKSISAEPPPEVIYPLGADFPGF